MSIFLLFNLFSLLILQQSSANANAYDISLQTYIVHVDKPEIHLLSQQSHDLESWYHSFLPTTPTTSSDTPRMLYSYRNVFSGFAARLTSDEVKAMEQKKGFISAKPEQSLPLHTTHTPNFLGLNENTGFWKESNYGRGMIIGILDTGIFPDHPSFSDEGMPPPPAKWKGTCEYNFTGCNKKLIGARLFKSGGEMPLDQDGHGTHVASIAAGNFVKGANIFGNANGTAAGIAPLAHSAIYKVCETEGCSESDVLAGMDMAIEDGVDVLSVSFGTPNRQLYDDNVALGAFSAVQRGIFVSCSVGNTGPYPNSLSNEAPWILTVGASTIDRSLRATALLGNNVELNGESAFQPNTLPRKQLNLVYPGSNESDFDGFHCRQQSLENNNVQGKIVLCYMDGGSFQVQQGQAVKDAGGAAIILMNVDNQGFTTSAATHVIPATNINHEDASKILHYINSTTSPTTTIVFKGTIYDDKKAPAVAAFSSRGPGYASLGILKPDIIGPGVDILAAWPKSVENNAKSRNNFNVLSGTSMSSAHLSGIAALIKNAHPNWSPAAIKSAIMTTADTVNLENQPILDENHRPSVVFATGAGQVNPSRATDPGLVYDIEPQDYLPYLCGLNYTSREVSKIFLQRVNCSEHPGIPEGQLNYPSFVVVFGQYSNQRFTRTVTNVGNASGSYVVEIVSPEGVDVIVKPQRLEFSELNQKLTYEVNFRRLGNGDSGFVSQGHVLWKSGKHSVRSPIAVQGIEQLLH